MNELKITELAASFCNLKDTIINIENQNNVEAIEYVLLKTESDCLNMLSKSDSKFIIVPDLDFELCRSNGDILLYANTYIMLKLYENLFKPITHELYKAFGYFLYIHNVILSP